MPLVVPSEAELSMLNVLTTSLLDNAKLCLFQFMLDVDEDLTLALLEANEAGFSGYARIDLDAWGVATEEGIRAVLYHPRRTFVHNGGGISNEIYGYFIVNSSGTDLICAERDVFGPITMAVLNDPYSVIPSFSLKSEFEESP